MKSNNSYSWVGRRLFHTVDKMSSVEKRRSPFRASQGLLCAGLHSFLSVIEFSCASFVDALLLAHCSYNKP